MTLQRSCCYILQCLHRKMVSWILYLIMISLLASQRSCDYILQCLNRHAVDAWHAKSFMNDFDGIMRESWRRLSACNLIDRKKGGYVMNLFYKFFFSNKKNYHFFRQLFLPQIHLKRISSVQKIYGGFLFHKSSLYGTIYPP